MPASRSTSSSPRPETALTMSRFRLRLTFAGAVSPDAVIQHLLETFNDDASLVEAVAELLSPGATAEDAATR